jgi:hypothetical protein
MDTLTLSTEFEVEIANEHSTDKSVTFKLGDTVQHHVAAGKFSPIKEGRSTSDA